MATLSTNTTQTSVRPLLADLICWIKSLKPTPKTADEHLATAHRREAARARVDNLLR